MLGKTSEEERSTILVASDDAVSCPHGRIGNKERERERERATNDAAVDGPPQDCPGYCSLSAATEETEEDVVLSVVYVSQLYVVRDRRYGGDQYSVLDPASY